MGNRRFFRGILPCAWLLIGTLAVAGALAHETAEHGDYVLVVGLIVEPAFEGEKNGVDLRVTRDGEPVEGLAETLQVEVVFEPTGAARILPLRALFGQPGHYTADFIPTSPGAYSLRFFGTIGEQAIDERYVPRSLGGGFNDVQAASAIHFPEPLPSLRQLEAAVRGAQDAAWQAQDAADAANEGGGPDGLTVLALVLGVVGSGLGVVSVIRR